MKQQNRQTPQKSRGSQGAPVPAVEELQREVGRLELLVSDLLDASRVQQGHLDLHTERLDLSVLARRVVERAEHSPEWTDGHRLTVVAPTPVWGEWDEALRIADIDAHFVKLRKAIGPPWNKDHKLAMAAAIVAASAVVE